MAKSCLTHPAKNGTMVGRICLTAQRSGESRGRFSNSSRRRPATARRTQDPILKNRRCGRSLWNSTCCLSSCASQALWWAALCSSSSARLIARRLRKKRSAARKKKPDASSTRPSRAARAKSAKCCSRQRKRSINRVPKQKRKSRNAARRSRNRNAVCSRRKNRSTKSSISTRRRRTSWPARWLPFRNRKRKLLRSSAGRWRCWKRSPA